MKPFLVMERDGAVVTVRMNHPDTRNAVSTAEQMAEFSTVCAEIRADSTVRAVILTGNGTAFCAGGNVKDMAAKRGIAEGSPYRIRNTYRDGVQRIPLSLYELEVPVIAAINGPAIGLGLDLACMCDIRIASDKALFAESFVKLGIVAGDGGAWLLPRIVGLPKATLMALTGDTISAAEALVCQLVTLVVPGNELEVEARNLAHRIAANPGHALRLTKRLLREGQHVRLDTLLELSAAFQALAHHTADHEEAVDAFLTKRPPHFTDQ